MSKKEVLSLDEHARRLVAWLCTVHPVPYFDTIVVLDTTHHAVEYVAGHQYGWRAPSSAILTVSEFTSRFDQYLRAGYSWVNLSAYGLLGSQLVLGVELPPRGPSNVPVGLTAVNYSGPASDPQTQMPIWQAPIEIHEGL